MFLQQISVLFKQLLLVIAWSDFCCIVISQAEVAARPARNGSIGSRGSRTYMLQSHPNNTFYKILPIQRSITPHPKLIERRSMIPLSSRRYIHPFISGFLGGALGTILSSLFVGYGLFGSVKHFGDFLGSFFQLFIGIIIISWIIKRFRSSRKNYPTIATYSPSEFQRAKDYRVDKEPAGSQQPRPFFGSVSLTHSDIRAFQQLLLDIQTSWSQQDLRALKHFATAEMVAYFNEELTDLNSRGAHNIVFNVHIDHCQVTETWKEGNYDFASILMRYSMIDMTTDITGRVIDKSSPEPVVANELWTFVRTTNEGNWLLSAIQQISW